MLCEVRSLGLSGISGYEVRAECDLSAGLPAFEIVGLPDAAVKEARDRVRAAIKNCGFTFPVSRITVNLAPANQRKGGTVYDLPILAGILAAGGQLRLDGPDSAYVGELSLSGSLRPVVGMLPMALAGAEFNVAIGMSRLGHTVGYLTKLGNDPFGKRIVKIMNQNNISTELITHTDERTTGFMLKSSVEQGDPEIFYYRKGSAASTLSAGDVHALDFARYDTLHMTGILPALTDSTREATAALLEKARENKMLFSFDPNLRPQLWGDRQKMIDYMNRMSGECDIFLPGVAEAGILLEEHRPEYIAEAYLKRGAKTVIVKLGGKGAYYASSSSSGYVPGFPVETIVDTVGAGDGFAAGVLSALREGLSLEDAVRRGNAIGAIQVMSLGDNDGLPTREELDAFMNGKKDWRKEHV